MSGLSKTLFTVADLKEVQSFDCGSEPFEKEVSDWLKGAEGTDSAVTSTNHPMKPSIVWLYRLDLELVGFGALAKSDWRWLGKNNDPKIPVMVIINAAIQTKFMGKPDGPKENRYSTQIFDDLVNTALLEATEYPILGLFVHKQNLRAIQFYKRLGFDDRLIQPKKGDYLKMFIVLDADVLKAKLGG